jgi:predicted dehydrogenase
VLGIDLEETKLELARAGGAQAAVLRSGDVTQAVAALTGGRGMDAVIICAAASSNDPIELAGEIARDRGRVVVVGAVPMDVPRRPFYDKELSLLLSRSYGPGRYDPAYEEHGRDYPAAYVRWTEERNFGAFLELCNDRRVDVRPLISHRFPIDRAGEAYRLLSGEREEPYLGIVLTYPEREVARAVSLGKATEGRALGEVRPGEVRLGFVGAGAFAGSVLVPAFARSKRARLKTIVSARGISARHLGLRFGFSDASTDFADLCADEALDAVVIATRHNLHAAQTVAGLEAGKHVFVEKPMAISRAEVEAVRKAAARSGRIVLVGFNRRFASLSRRLAQHFEERASPLAMTYRVNAGRVAPESWIRDPAVGGGRIVGEVCHFVDLLSFLAGAPPVRVQAVGATDSAGSSPDAQLIATLTFGDGSVGTIVYSSEGDPAFPKERLEVLGQGRIAVLDDFRTLEMSANGRRTYARSVGQDKGHRAEAEQFVGAVADGKPSPISLESLCATSLATFAIEDAMRSGETQVL